MKFIPHDYQSYCTEYIKTHPTAALFWIWAWVKERPS